ncbi:MFS transporter [Thermoleophilia bacterium SCSIO 60948]|nr:MFS transporter [Thermoleophilia bacterium SCSIO 60948]
MSSQNAVGGAKRLTLIAMIFAVSMTFIDQTIVSIAVPDLQNDLGLSESGVQWVVNGYLLALAALFAFGGRIADIAGHRRMVMIGIAIFATASALCGATPSGSFAEPWLIVFRVIQGAGAAIMFPAALAIVVSAYPQGERGKALAIFFGVAGGLTAVGPLAGGYLIEVSWRLIFLINVPIALAAIGLTLRAKPDDTRRPARLDVRGAVLFALGMGLLVLGLQQSAAWGWDSPATIASIIVGALALVAFVRAQLVTPEPLMQVRIFRGRGFAADAAILFFISIAFVPMFLFASMYSQISLGEDASNAGLYIGTFFFGFVIAAQWGGRILDARGAKPAAILGTAVGAVGFYLWAKSMPAADYDDQWWRLIVAGAGTGLVFGPISTDALNRAPGTSYGEVTGITQTVRNLAASLGLAVLGTLLISQNRSNIESTLASEGIPKSTADEVAQSLSQGSGGDSSGFSHGGEKAKEIFAAVQHDFGVSMETVFLVMAGAMVLAFIVALVFLPAGKVPEAEIDDDAPAPAL